MEKNVISEADISKKVADIHEEIQPALYQYNENPGESPRAKLKLYYDSMIGILRKCIRGNNNRLK